MFKIPSLEVTPNELQDFIHQETEYKVILGRFVEFRHACSLKIINWAGRMSTEELDTIEKTVDVWTQFQRYGIPPYYKAVNFAIHKQITDELESLVVKAGKIVGTIVSKDPEVV